MRMTWRSGHRGEFGRFEDRGSTAKRLFRRMPIQVREKWRTGTEGYPHEIQNRPKVVHVFRTLLRSAIVETSSIISL
jgi:hypothetical protein